MEKLDWEREEVAREAFGHRKMKRNFFSAFLDLKYFQEDVKIGTLLFQLGRSEKIKYSSTRRVELFYRNKCTRTLEDYLRDTKNKYFYYSIFLFLFFLVEKKKYILKMNNCCEE